MVSKKSLSVYTNKKDFPKSVIEFLIIALSILSASELVRLFRIYVLGDLVDKSMMFPLSLEFALLLFVVPFAPPFFLAYKLATLINGFRPFGRWLLFVSTVIFASLQILGYDPVMVYLENFILSTFTWINFGIFLIFFGFEYFIYLLIVALLIRSVKKLYKSK